ncbi:AMP-binding protein [Pontibacillus yanchengensis]|uniref:AMP-binding protein n=2 Tax=Pontibacillus yanchengensis TaxID=462910 RepID=A0A6I4ZVV6_9BACI|nr:AMP-binding protein [Pontibacillus yanchengensis]MYL32080.1 AMP-binding protein [Pontibacillus yanchengensis]MYL52660.1 AMP-binding protein [Pontibacillus yanchengensis]
MLVNEMNRVAIGDMVRRTAGRVPNKAAFVDGDVELNYKQLDEKTNQFAHYLLNNGYQKGDCIATIAGNSYEHAIAFFGLAKAGMTWVPINPGISLAEKQYILEEVEATTILGDPAFLFNNLEDFKHYSLYVFGDEAPKAGTSFISTLENQSTEEPEVDIQDRDIAQIMFTSGTTGNPKGVMISHQSVFIASLANIIEIDIKPHTKATIMMPMFHCAQHTFLASFVHIGATCVVIKGFEPASLMQTVQDESISLMFALPIMYKAILFHPNREQYDLSSLDTCVYAMAPMDRSTLEKGIKEFGAKFALGTGQTEMYPATMVFKPEEQLRRFGSYWGTSSLINDTAIMDDEGNILPDGQVGEIVHRGPNVMSGYLNNDEASEQTREFNWHHTGDLGYWDEDGQMVFVDRKKDIIKTGGENVASIKVEQTILNHPSVGNAVVVGLPHERWSEAVTAFVVPAEGKELTKEEVISYCKEHLGAFQVPKDVLIVDELPMTTTGKIQKHRVRTQFQSHYMQGNPMERN